MRRYLEKRASLQLEAAMRKKEMENGAEQQSHEDRRFISQYRDEKHKRSYGADEELERQYLLRNSSKRSPHKSF